MTIYNEAIADIGEMMKRGDARTRGFLKKSFPRLCKIAGEMGIDIE